MRLPPVLPKTEEQEETVKSEKSNEYARHDKRSIHEEQEETDGRYPEN